MTPVNNAPSIIEDCGMLGLDLSPVDANLRLPPETRAVRQHGALELAIALTSATPLLGSPGA